MDNGVIISNAGIENRETKFTTFRKYFAFTLAEVLITLAVIGIIAIMLLPPFITNFNENIYTQRQVNVAQKVTKAMEQMRSLGLLNERYATTELFVDELEKFLKVSKRCDNEHLSECWPSKTVKTSDGRDFNINNARTGNNLNLDYNSDTVGLVLADGAAIILSYNTDSDPISENDRVKTVFRELPIGHNKKNFFTERVQQQI